MYLGEDVIFDVVGVMLDKEAQQLEDKAENLNARLLVGNSTKMKMQGGITCTVQLSVFSGDPAPVFESRGAMNTEICFLV